MVAKTLENSSFMEKNGFQSFETLRGSKCVTHSRGQSSHPVSSDFNFDVR